jgi:hypothetical protein
MTTVKQVNGMAPTILATNRELLDAVGDVGEFALVAALAFPAAAHQHDLLDAVWLTEDVSTACQPPKKCRAIAGSSATNGPPSEADARFTRAPVQPAELCG